LARRGAGGITGANEGIACNGANGLRKRSRHARGRWIAALQWARPFAGLAKAEKVVVGFRLRPPGGCFYSQLRLQAEAPRGGVRPGQSIQLSPFQRPHSLTRHAPVSCSNATCRDRRTLPRMRADRWLLDRQVSMTPMRPPLIGHIPFGKPQRVFPRVALPRRV
jgi:hypothetical protein